MISRGGGAEDACSSREEGSGREAEEVHELAIHAEFDFPGDLASVAGARDEIMRFVCQHCHDQEEQIDILVAVQEALANAALHGCGDDSLRHIQCKIAANAADVTIIIRDPGSSFDVTLADPGNYAPGISPHGRGICLMRSLMTDVTFARQGSEIQLRKSITVEST